MRVLDLFSGIGGFSLGLERAGFTTVAFCEIDKFCQRVLKKHWPEVPIFDDVRELSAQHLTAAGIVPDLICGGFPCQDISTAGKGAGIEGERSGLWKDYARLIGEIRPRFVVVENVSALLARGLERVLGDLASLGYDAEWHCIPAAAVGAPHRRDRIWIVAYPGHSCWRSYDASCGRDTRELAVCEGQQSPIHPRDGRETLADANSEGYEGEGCWQPPGWRLFTDSNIPRFGEFEVEPELGRVAYGIPDWSHRIKALGNAVVPQIPELIGRAIMSSLQQG